MARMKPKQVDQDAQLPPELAQFNPWDGWFDKAYASTNTGHDSSSLAYEARNMWLDARREAGVNTFPDFRGRGWIVLREYAAEYLELKGHDPEVWHA